MRWSLPLLFAAIAAFLLGALLTLLALARESQLIAAVAVVAMAASMVLFLLSIWGRRGKVDWERIETEQRLWESGPLGRSWLRVRQRLHDLWKI